MTVNNQIGDFSSANNPIQWGYCQAQSPQERKEFLGKQFDRAVDFISNNPDMEIDLSFRQFLNAHIPFEVEGTEYEANTTDESLVFWEGLFNVLSKNLFFPFKPEQIEAVKTALADLRYVNTSLKMNSEYAGECIRDFIAGKLKSRGYCYFLEGYANGPKNKGHSMAVKAEKRGSLADFHLLNEGGGSQEHPQIDFDETSMFLSYRYLPITMELNDLENEVWLDMFQRQAEIMKTSPSFDVRSYDHGEIYDKYKMMGTVQSAYQTDPMMHRGDYQLSQTCAENAVRLVIKDVLIVSGLSPEEVQRFFLRARAFSLLLARNKFLNEICKNKTDARLYLQSARAFAVRVEAAWKAKLISTDEVILFQGIVDKLIKEIEPACDLKPKKQNPSTQGQAHLVSLTGIFCETRFKTYNVPTHTFNNAYLPFKVKTNDVIIEEVLLPKASEIGTSLKSWHHNANLFAAEEHAQAVSYIAQVAMALPIPGVSDYWDGCSVEDINGILKYFMELSYIAYVRGDTGYSQVKLFIALQTFSAICDYLLRRLPEAKWQGVRLNFWPEALKKQFAGVCLADDQKRVLELEKYFLETSQKHPKPVFSFDERVDLNKVAEDIKNSKHTQGATNYFNYLLQFYEQYSQSNPAGLKHSTESYFNFWQKSQDYLPESVCNAHCINFLSYLFISGKGYSGSIRQPYKPDSSHNCLKIEYAKEERGFKRYPTIFQHEDRQIAADILSKGASLNDAFCAKTQDNYSKQFICNLMRFSCEKDLEITTFVDWLKSNFTQINSSYTWTPIFETIFFRPGALPQALTENPALIEEIRKITRTMLEYFSTKTQEHEIGVFAYMIQFAICFESFVKDIDGSNYSSNTLREIAAVLNQIVATHHSRLVKQVIASARMLIYSFYPKLERTETSELYRKALDLLAFKDSNLWIYLQAWDAYRKLEPQLVEALKDQKFLDECCGLLFNLYTAAQFEIKGSWSGNYPVYKLGNYTVDLSRFVIDYPLKAAANKFPIEKYNLSEGEKSILSEVTGHWCNGNNWISDCGKIRAIVQDTKEVFVQMHLEMAWALGPSWYEVFQNHYKYKWIKEFADYLKLIVGKDSEKLMFLKSLYPLHDEVYAIDYRTKKKCYRIKGNQIHRMSPDGTFPEDYLVNVANDTGEFAEWLKSIQLEGPARILWNKDQKRIVSMQLPDYNLEFHEVKIGTEYFMKCKEHPEYYLAAEQTIPSLADFPYKVVLKSLSGETKVCLVDADYSVNHKAKGKVEYCRASFNIHSYVYNAHFQTGELVGNLPKENELLSRIYFLLKDYERALVYLRRMSTFSFFISELDFFKFLRESSDHSPNATGFYFQAALILFENENQILNRRSGSNNSSVIRYSEFIVEIYPIYLKLIGDGETSRILPKLRLDLNTFQEIRLLANLEKYTTLTPLLKNRLGLLRSQSREFTTQLTSLQYPAYPGTLIIDKDSLKSIADIKKSQFLRTSICCNPRSGPKVRFEAENNDFNPLILFDRALKAPRDRLDSIDLDILFLKRSAKDSLATDTGKLIAIVRKFPDQFKDLTFFPNMDEAQRLYLINQIVDRALKVVEGITETLISGPTTKKIESFVYKQLKERTLKLAPPKLILSVKWTFRDDRVKELVLMLKSPLGGVSKAHLNGVPQTPPYIQDRKAFALEAYSKTPKSELEHKIFSSLVEGHEENLKKQVTNYRIKTSLEALEKDLNAKINETQTQLDTLMNTIEKEANKRPSDATGIVARDVLLKDLIHDLRVHGQQDINLDVHEPIVEALLMKDLSYIHRHNPTLSHQEVQKIAADAMQFLILSCKVNQAKKALGLINNYREKGGLYLQELGELLDWSSLDFDPFEMPEIVIYTYLTGKHLRLSQLKILKWILAAPIDDKLFPTMMFAFEAGGGKTSVLMVLLMFRALREGKIPVAFAPPNLYPIDRDNFRMSMINTFKKRTSVLEISMRSDIDGPRAKAIASLLRKVDEERHNVVAVPESMYSIGLRYLSALNDDEEEVFLYLGTVFNQYFKNRVKAHIDECKETLGPLTQAKVGLGKPKKLPRNERQLFLKIYKLQTGLIPISLPDGRPVAEVMRFSEDKQSRASQEDLQLVKEAITNYLLKDPELKVKAENEKEIKAFWLDITKDAPAVLMKMHKSDPQTANLHGAIREYFYSIFPTVAMMKDDINYKQSSTYEESIYKPCYRRKPSPHYFEDPFMTMAVTIQGTIHKGLTYAQIYELISHVKMLRMNEIISGIRKFNVSIKEVWRSWSSDLPDLDLLEEGLSYDYAFSENRVANLLRKNLNAIFWYLDEVVLKQVVYTPQQIVLNPVHLLRGTSQALFFSAYPGVPELYGFNPGAKEKELCRQDFPFAAAVVQQACAPQNREILRLNPTSLENFFTGLTKSKPGIFNELHAFNDVKGMLKDYSNRDFARAFLKYSKDHDLGFNGILIYDDNDEEKVIYIGHDGKEIVIPPGDIIESFAMVSLDWNKMKVMVYFDINHSIGANITLPPLSLTLFMIGDGIELGIGIQGIMRSRLFLISQRIAWGIDENAEKDMEKRIKEKLSSESFWIDSIRAEAASTKPEIILNGYHEIQYIIEKPIWDALAASDGDAQAQREIFKKHKGAFIKENPHEPFKNNCFGLKLEDVETVYWRYAEMMYADCKYATKLKRDSTIGLEIQAVISKIKKLIKTTESRHSTARKLTLVHCHQQKQVKQVVKTSVASDLKPVASIKLANDFCLTSGDFTNRMLLMSRPAVQIFGSKNISPNLYYTENMLQTAESDGKMLKEKFLKPPKYLLFVQKDSKSALTCFAIADNEAAHFLRQLRNKKTTSVPKDYKVMMITMHGIILKQIPDSLRFSDKEWEAIEKTQHYQDLRVDAAILHGDIVYPHRLIDRLQKWNDFPVLWEKVLDWSATPDAILRQSIEKLIPKRIKPKNVA